MIAYRAIIVLFCFMLSGSAAASATTTTTSAVDEQQEDACSICLEKLTHFPDTVNLMCGKNASVKHSFHTDCIKQSLAVRPDCPLCRTEINSANNAIIALASYTLRYPRRGAKILNAQLTEAVRIATPIIIYEPAPTAPSIPSPSLQTKMLALAKTIIAPATLGACVGAVVGLAAEINPYTSAAVVATATVVGSYFGNYLRNHFTR